MPDRRRGGRSSRTRDDLAVVDVQLLTTPASTDSIGARPGVGVDAAVPQPGTARSRAASTGPENDSGRRSRVSWGHHQAVCTATAASKTASNAVLPNPAGAETSVTGRGARPGRGRQRRGRGLCQAACEEGGAGSAEGVSHHAPSRCQAGPSAAVPGVQAHPVRPDGLRDAQHLCCPPRAAPEPGAAPGCRTQPASPTARDQVHGFAGHQRSACDPTAQRDRRTRRGFRGRSAGLASRYGDLPSPWIPSGPGQVAAHGPAVDPARLQRIRGSPTSAI